MKRTAKSALLSAIGLFACSGTITGYAAQASTEIAAQTSEEGQKSYSEGAQTAISAGDVVVTASGFEESLRIAPASITVIGAEQIAERGYTDLRQVLDTVEGIDTFGATGRFDTPAISIRGMDDGYTLILVDGVAQTGPGIAGGMMRSFNQLANTSLPSPSQIERIEIVRGPMSTLYGSDAMGGVINIITKKVTDEFSGTVEVGSLFETSDDKANMTKYAFHVAGPITREKVGMQLRGSYMDRGASAYGVDKEKRDLRNWNLGTRITYTPAEGQSYYFDIDRGQNMRYGDFAQMQKMPVPPPMSILFPTATVQMQAAGELAQRFDRTKVVLGAENKLGKGMWTNTISFLRNEMHFDADLAGTAKPSIMPLTIPLTSSTRNRVKNDFFTLDTKYVLPAGDAHDLVLGGRWQRESVDYHLKRQLTPGAGAPPPFVNMMRRKSSDDQGSLSRSTWALFAEDTWSFTPRLSLTYGARYDHPEDYGDNVSPRAYLVYTANEHLTIKGGIATGYKAPTMLQAAPVDVHLNVTGEIYRGNTNLQPEKSMTEEIGIYYKNQAKTEAHLTLFHTRFKDKIDLGDPVTTPLGSVRTYENVGKARIHGVELGTKFAIAPRVTAGVNWTWLTSRIESGANEGQPLRSTPKQSLNLRLDWQPTDATTVWLMGQHRSGMYRSKQATGLSSTYAPFTVFNLGVTHKLQKDLTLQFAVNNLFDKNFDRTTTVGAATYHDYYDDLDADGIAGGSYLSRRSFWVGLAYGF